MSWPGRRRSPEPANRLYSRGMTEGRESTTNELDAARPPAGEQRPQPAAENAEAEGSEERSAEPWHVQAARDGAQRSHRRVLVTLACVALAVAIGVALLAWSGYVSERTSKTPPPPYRPGFDRAASGVDAGLPSTPAP